MTHQLTQFVEDNGNRVTFDEAVAHFTDRRGSEEDAREYVEYWLADLDELVTDRFGGEDRIEKVVY